MQISPNVAVIINIVLGVLTLISSGTLSFTGIVSPATAAQIVAWSASGIAVINVVMHAFASSAPGPLAPPDAPVVVAAQKVADLPANAPRSQVTAVKAAAVAKVADHEP